MASRLGSAERRREIGWLLAILALGTAARFWKLDFDLPEVAWVDAFKFVMPAASYARTGELQFIDYQYPGLYAMLLAGLYAGLGLESPYAQQLAACAVAAAFGSATVLAVWIAAGAVCGSAGRALAALLTAVSPVLVTYARVPVSDGVVACFLAAAFAWLARRPLSLAAAAGGGALVGLATGTKFSGAQGLVLVLAALAARDLPARAPRRFAQHAGACVTACALAFWITTPWFFAHLQDYAQRMLAELYVQAGGQIGRVQLRRLDYLISHTPTWETPWLGTSLWGTEGPLVLAAGLAAAGAALWRRPSPALFAGALFALLSLAAHSGPGRVKAIRFLAPVLPIWFVLIGWLVERVLAARLGTRRRPALILLGVALLAVPAVRTARYLSLHRRPSTHVLARAWIHASLPPGTPAFLAPFYADDLDDGHLSVLRLPDPGSRQYRFPEGVGPSAERDLLYHPGVLDQARRAGVRYLILNSYFDDGFRPVAENRAFFPRAVAGYAAFRERLAREASPVHRIVGLAEGRLGPDIEVWRLGPPAGPEPGASGREPAAGAPPG